MIAPLPNQEFTTLREQTHVLLFPFQVIRVKLLTMGGHRHCLYNACLEGEIQKRREFVHTVTLHAILVINSRTQGFFALFAGDTDEIKPDLRNTKDAEWFEKGKVASIIRVRSSLFNVKIFFFYTYFFIDEGAYVKNRILPLSKSSIRRRISTLAIMAPNHGMARIRGTKFRIPHGLTTHGFA